MRPRLSTSILDYLFPEKCLSCGRQKTLLCQECLEGLPAPLRPLPLYIDALLDYQNSTARKIIWYIKYKNAMSLIKTVGMKMHEKLSTHLSTDDRYILIPIPIRKNRLRNRGYNQAEELAKTIRDSDKLMSFILVTNVLYIKRLAENQSDIKDRKARLENLKGFYGVKNKALIKNKKIILIDDVTTTGATINEARNLLLRSGAASVRALTVAH